MVFNFLYPSFSDDSQKKINIEPSEKYLFPFVITKKKQAKRLILRINVKKKAFCLTVPSKTSHKEIQKFLSHHHHWIEEKINHTKKISNIYKIEPEGMIPFQGIPHKIIHEPDKRGIVHLEQDDRGYMMVVHAKKPHIQRHIKDFLKKEARKELLHLVMKHSHFLGEKPKSVCLKDTSSRWGSCNSQGDISFSWRIIMAPPNVIDYLVAHEMAHIKEMNHKENFWQLCQELCPHMQEARQWLKKNGSILQSICFLAKKTI